MPQVEEVIRGLFPGGTNAAKRPNWSSVPQWPPDSFAAAATLVSLSGCYSSPRYNGGIEGKRYFTGEYLKEISSIAKGWAGSHEYGNAIERVDLLWRVLWKNKNRDAVALPSSEYGEEFCDAALSLMTAADAASFGMGFLNTPGRYPAADFVCQQYHLFFNQANTKLPWLPWSLCRQVPPSAACVQPKTRTPQTGCTLRSLSHNLALLPPYGEVATAWLLCIDGEAPSNANRTTFNLLLVPYPFRVDGGCFVEGSGCLVDRLGRYPKEERDRWRFFKLEQRWLRHGGGNISAVSFANFLLDMVKEAERELSRIDGIVLPELALDQTIAEGVASLLGRERPGLDFFISGIARKQDGGLPRNCVFCAAFREGEVLLQSEQSKHHRWKLDERQVCRYHLGDSLYPDSFWWEYIDVTDRKCLFHVFRHGLSLATLVCEDLARVDPVQPVVRSIGPNLLIALLMDGPQLERRWSGRYATVLADDPGSGVLTLTSLGMVQRSSMPGEKECRQVALWKGEEGVAQELSIPPGCHGLALTLSTKLLEHFTLDGRSDGRTTRGLQLSAVRPVRHSAPPSWANSS
jgi:hypothetical protein